MRAEDGETDGDGDSVSGMSALTKSFPSCPGETSPASSPLIMYATPATSDGKKPKPHARRKPYVKQPARKMWMTNPHVSPMSVGSSSRSSAVG